MQANKILNDVTYGMSESVNEFTGTKTVRGLLGFSQTSQITVTQSVPLKLTLLGLEYRVSIGN